MVHAATGKLAHGFHRIHVSRIDHIGCAELLGKLQLAGHPVDGNDAARAGNCRTVDGGQADAAAADHRHGLARAHAGSVDDRAHAGGHRAADQRGTVQRHVAADGHQRVLVDQHLLGKGGEVQELVHGRALGQQARLLALAALGVGLHAQRQVACQAVLAMAAIGRQAGDHMIAGLDRAHFGTHLLDHAGRLMPKHHRHREGIGAV